MNGATDNNLDKDIESFSSIKDNKKKPERSRSKILAGLNRFTAWFYSLFIGGLIGGIFTFYKKMQK